jgi:MFS family permease
LIFQQFLGIPLIFGYSTYFFSLAGLTDPFLGSLIVTLIFLTFILVSFFTVEAVGRRKSLMVGGAVMGICTLVIGILGTVSSSLNGAALIALCAVWVMAYALSAGPLGMSLAHLIANSFDDSGWTFVGETSTPRLRAKTAGVAAGSSSCVGIIFAFTVPKMLANPGANWGLKIGYLFSGLTVVGLIVIYLTIPETRARTYSELDELFERRIPANRFATTKTQVDAARDEVTGAVA